MAKVSSVGYYHEWLIMQELTKLDFAIPVTFPQLSTIDDRVAAAYDKYTIEIPTAQPKSATKFLQAVERSQISAPILAKKILQDIPTDKNYDEIIISHVGGAGLGKNSSQAGGKADILVEARTGNSIETLISASIKISINDWITLLTSPPAKLMQKLFWPNVKFARGADAWNNIAELLAQDGLEQFIEPLLTAEQKRAELSEKKAHAKSIKDKELIRKIELEMIPHINNISDLIFGDILSFYQSRSPEMIVENVTRELGLDSANTVYKSTFDVNNELLSSTSTIAEPMEKEFQQQLKDFTISVEPAGRKTSATRSFKMISNGNVFWDSKVQFQQSGAGAYKIFTQ